MRLGKFSLRRVEHAGGKLKATLIIDAEQFEIELAAAKLLAYRSFQAACADALGVLIRFEPCEGRSARSCAEHWRSEVDCAARRTAEVQA
jgi:hypothetical protein